MIVLPDWGLLGSAFLAAAVAAFTPGPNNAISMALGVNYGLKRALPFVLGVTFGFPILVIVVGLGLGGLINAVPDVLIAVKIVGALFLLYLAYKIGTARSIGGANDSTPGFWKATFFQWINPKAIAFCLSLIAFTRPSPELFFDVGYLAIIGAMNSFGATTVWATFGTAISGFFKTQRRLRIFNIAMALLLVVAAVLIFVDFETGFTL